MTCVHPSKNMTNSLTDVAGAIQYVSNIVLPSTWRSRAILHDAIHKLMQTLEYSLIFAVTNVRSMLNPRQLNQIFKIDPPDNLHLCLIASQVQITNIILRAKAMLQIHLDYKSELLRINLPHINNRSSVETSHHSLLKRLVS